MIEDDSVFNSPIENIEYIEPNLSLAYAELAPMVAEAWAYTVSGKSEEAQKSLRLARQVIDMVSMRMAVFKTESKDTSESAREYMKSSVAAGWHDKNDYECCMGQPIPPAQPKRPMPSPNTINTGE